MASSRHSRTVFQYILAGIGAMPQCLEEQEGCPWHAVGSGQERGPGTQDSDKAPKEDPFAAMLAEEVLPQFHFALIEAKVMTVAAQQTVATFAPNPVAEIIAQNCTTGSRHDHQRRREAVGHTRIDGCDEPHRSATTRQSHTCHV